MKTYEQLKDELLLCIDSSDTEVAHTNADILIVNIALHTELTKEQRKELVDMYEAVNKWYS